MSKVVYNSLDQLSKDFEHLINNQFLSDVLLYVGKQKQPIYAHKVVIY